MNKFLILMCLASCKTTSSSFWSSPSFQSVDFEISLDRTNNSVAVRAFVRETQIAKPNPENSIKFILHTRGNQQGTIFQQFDRNILFNIKFDFNLETKVLIHGFANSADSKFNTNLKKVYLRQARHNLILVDWGSLCSAPFYNSALDNMRLVSERTAQLLEWLKAEGLSLARVHILGHSIGAHIAGITAQHLRHVGTVRRITGLDPAKPMLELSTKEHRLTEDDAEYVDCIHTCGGFLGVSEPICSADFYPNGGTSPQPGCKFDIFGVCSHQRAYRFYAESIEAYDSFASLKCSAVENYSPVNCSNTSFTVMGEHVNTRERGIFYLSTALAPPFSLEKSFDVNSFTQFTWYFR